MKMDSVCKYLVVGVVLVLVAIVLFVKPTVNKPCLNCNKNEPLVPKAGPKGHTEAEHAPVKPVEEKPKKKVDFEEKKPKVEKPPSGKKAPEPTPTCSHNKEANGIQGYESGDYASWN